MLNPILKAIDAFLVAKGPDLVLCNSMFTKDLSEKIYGKTIREIVYPGTDIHHFIPQQTKKHYFFSFAHLTKFKEIHVAIEAMAKIKNRDYSLVIGGEGEEKDALIGLSKRLGLSGRVRFVGLVPPDELPKLYAESKLLLFTSKHEPFGMVPIEAMASGTPVIGPNSGGLRETIKHNYNGILLDELTADHMAKAIDDLLDAPDKYDYLRKNARISAEKFSWEKHVEKLETALNELVHSHRG